MFWWHRLPSLVLTPSIARSTASSAPRGCVIHGTHPWSIAPCASRDYPRVCKHRGQQRCLYRTGLLTNASLAAEALCANRLSVISFASARFTSVASHANDFTSAAMSAFFSGVRLCFLRFSLVCIICRLSCTLDKPGMRWNLTKVGWCPWYFASSDRPEPTGGASA